MINYFRTSKKYRPQRTAEKCEGHRGLFKYSVVLFSFSVALCGLKTA